MSEFCVLPSNIVASYPNQAGMTTMYNRYVWGRLYSACAPETVEWYLNNERIRRRISNEMIEFMAFGTTGSEAVNAELKAWFGRIVSMHAPILRLKLRIFHVCKLSAFCSAKYNATTVQERHPMVMARVIGEFEAFSDEWVEWCDGQPGRSSGNTPELMETRKKHAIRRANWASLQNNANRKDKRKIKRTAFKQKKRD